MIIPGTCFDVLSILNLAPLIRILDLNVGFLVVLVTLFARFLFRCEISITGFSLILPVFQFPH